MSATATSPKPPEITSDVPVETVLAQFLQNNLAATKVSQSLKAGAEIGITFTNQPGHWRMIHNEAGATVFEAGVAVDPDFELQLPPKAVTNISSMSHGDIGDLGIAFFEHVASREQELKIHVKVHSGLVKLTKHGWMGVMTQGGMKVMGWLAKRGLRGPAAVATAIGKLKN